METSAAALIREGESTDMQLAKSGLSSAGIPVYMPLLPGQVAKGKARSGHVSRPRLSPALGAVAGTVRCWRCPPAVAEARGPPGSAHPGVPCGSGQPGQVGVDLAVLAGPQVRHPDEDGRTAAGADRAAHQPGRGAHACPPVPVLSSGTTPPVASGRTVVVAPR